MVYPAGSQSAGYVLARTNAGAAEAATYGWVAPVRGGSVVVNGAIGGYDFSNPSLYRAGDLFIDIASGDIYSLGTDSFGDPAWNLLRSYQTNNGRKNLIIVETDFYNTTSAWADGLTGAAISAGTLAQIAALASHPGIVSLLDSTTANGGYRIGSAANALLLAGGEKIVCTFQPKTIRTTAQGWIGFNDQSTNVQPVDGAGLYWVGNGTTGVTISGRNSSNSVQSITPSTYTLANNTWATIVIELNAAATLVTYSLYNDAGTLLWTDTLATNIPTATGRETGVGIQANESTVDAAAALMWVDYFRAEAKRTLVR
jgi:hypothetical protein